MHQGTHSRTARGYKGRSAGHFVPLRTVTCPISSRWGTSATNSTFWTHVCFLRLVVLDDPSASLALSTACLPANLSACLTTVNLQVLSCTACAASIRVPLLNNWLFINTLFPLWFSLSMLWLKVGVLKGTQGRCWLLRLVHSCSHRLNPPRASGRSQCSQCRQGPRRCCKRSDSGRQTRLSRPL